MITIRYCSQGKLEVGAIGIILTKERKEEPRALRIRDMSLSSLGSHDVLTLFGLRLASRSHDPPSCAFHSTLALHNFQHLLYIHATTIEEFYTTITCFRTSKS